jgi:hypothetical protein
MDDAVLVRGFEGVGDLAGDGEGVGDVDGARGNQGSEILALSRAVF